MRRKTLPCSGTWHSTSCRRIQPKVHSAASSSAPDGRTPIWLSLSHYSEMRLPCGETATSDPGPAGPALQRPAVHGRGDPLGGAVVSDVPDQLSRSRAHAAGARCRGGSHDDLSLDPGLCGGTGEADPPASV